MRLVAWFDDIIPYLWWPISAKPTPLITWLSLLLVAPAKGFELAYQQDDPTELVKELLEDMTNTVICEVDHTWNRPGGIRKCKPGVLCTLFKKFYRTNRPLTPTLETFVKQVKKIVAKGIHWLQHEHTALKYCWCSSKN